MRFYKCVNYFFLSQFLSALIVLSPYVCQCPVPDNTFQTCWDILWVEPEDNMSFSYNSFAKLSLNNTICLHILPSMDPKYSVRRIRDSTVYLADKPMVMDGQTKKQKQL